MEPVVHSHMAVQRHRSAVPTRYDHPSTHLEPFHHFNSSQHVLAPQEFIQGVYSGYNNGAT